MRVLQNVMLGTVLCVVGMSVLGVGGAAAAQAPAPVADRWSQLFAANNLDNEGKTPFHLRMTFQLYDLKGKAAETGTVEEWWAPGYSRRIVIKSPSLNEDESTVNEGNAASVTRERYLVRELLDEAVHPVPQHPPGPAEKLEEHKRYFGKVELECETPASNAASTHHMSLPTLCIQPSTVYVRLLLNDSTAVERNTIGQFHDTYVALDVQENLLGLSAISGKVTLLQGIDPAKSADELKPLTAAGASPERGKIAYMSGGVIAGARIKFVQPQYPEAAKVEHKSGVVLLHALISKEGLVKDLVPIAVSDPVFTDEAIDAVRHWVYSPYLLNGEPTEVDTTITINFSMTHN